MRHNHQTTARKLSAKALIVATLGLAFAGASAVAPRAFAEDMELATAKTSWSTSSHLGYATQDRSSTGFAQVGGSLVFLDIMHPISNNLDLGLRSTAQGAHSGPDQFYRLGAGPLATYKINNDWSLQAAFNLFNETGLGAQSKAAYTSRGEEIQIGWERIWTLGRRVQVAGGSFASYHQGGVAAPAAISANSYNSIAHPNVNSGLSHGLEMALRLSM